MTNPNEGDTPLIYTKLGNLPINSLEYATRWEMTEDHIKFVETYSRDGEIMRESAHVLVLKPLESQIFTGKLGG